MLVREKLLTSYVSRVTCLCVSVSYNGAMGYFSCVHKLAWKVRTRIMCYLLRNISLMHHVPISVTIRSLY